MSWLKETKKKVPDKPFRQRTVKELLTAAPLAFTGVALTLGGLGYGLYGMLFGSMVQQARGMSMRVGFQFCTILILTGTLGYQQHLRDQEVQRQQLELREMRLAKRRKEKEERLELELAETQKNSIQISPELSNTVVQL